MVAEVRVNTPTNLVDRLGRILSDPQTGKGRYEGSRLPLDAINVLPQPRKTFGNIDLLAEDIAHKGILNPPTIARLDRRGCEEYLDIINGIWGTEVGVSILRPVVEAGNINYYVLLAGERRFRAHRYLAEHGCQQCNESYGPGGCYFRHEPDGMLDVRLCLGVSPLQAIFLQFSENTHMRVAPHEEAAAYYQLFSLVRKADPEYPVARFARDVSRRPEYIRSAIRFCELPPQIQGHVVKADLRYGIAIQIARLKYELSACDEELDWWATWAMAKESKVPEFKQTIDRKIEEVKSGQTMFDLFSQEQQKEMRRAAIRLTVEKEIIQALWLKIRYFKKVTEMLQNGKLGQEDSPFSHRSPVKVFRATVVVQRDLLPFLKSLLPRGSVEESRVVMTELGEVLEALENSLPLELSADGVSGNGVHPNGVYVS